MDLRDGSLLREIQNIAVAFQRGGMVLEPLSAEILFFKLVALKNFITSEEWPPRTCRIAHLDHGAHGAINDENALGKLIFQVFEHLGRVFSDAIQEFVTKLVRLRF